MLGVVLDITKPQGHGYLKNVFGYRTEYRSSMI